MYLSTTPQKDTAFSQKTCSKPPRNVFRHFSVLKRNTRIYIEVVYLTGQHGVRLCCPVFPFPQCGLFFNSIPNKLNFPYLRYVPFYPAYKQHFSQAYCPCVSLLYLRPNLSLFRSSLSYYTSKTVRIKPSLTISS